MRVLSLPLLMCILNASRISGYTVKRDAGFKDIDDEPVLDGALVVNEGAEHGELSEEHIHIVADNEFRVRLLSSDDYDESEDADDEMSVYESIRNESQNILTKIELLSSKPIM